MTVNNAGNTSQRPALTQQQDQLNILVVGNNLDEVARIRQTLQQANIRSCLHIVGDATEVTAYLMRVPPYTSAPIPNLVLISARLTEINRVEVHAQLQACRKLTDVDVVALTPSDFSDGFFGNAADIAAGCNGRPGLASYLEKALTAGWRVS